MENRIVRKLNGKSHRFPRLHKIEKWQIPSNGSRMTQNEHLKYKNYNNIHYLSIIMHTWRVLQECSKIQQQRKLSGWGMHQNDGNTVRLMLHFPHLCFKQILLDFKIIWLTLVSFHFFHLSMLIDLNFHLFNLRNKMFMKCHSHHTFKITLKMFLLLLSGPEHQESAAASVIIDWSQ